MKILLALLAIAITAGLMAPAKQPRPKNAHPSDRRVFSHHPCGAPIYSVYEVLSHDRGNPIGHWVIQDQGHELCQDCLKAKQEAEAALSNQRS